MESLGRTFVELDPNDKRAAAILKRLGGEYGSDEEYLGEVYKEDDKWVYESHIITNGIKTAATKELAIMAIVSGVHDAPVAGRDIAQSGVAPSLAISFRALIRYLDEFDLEFQSKAEDKDAVTIYSYGEPTHYEIHVQEDDYELRTDSGFAVLRSDDLESIMSLLRSRLAQPGNHVRKGAHVKFDNVELVSKHGQWTLMGPVKVLLKFRELTDNLDGDKTLPLVVASLVHKGFVEMHFDRAAIHVNKETAGANLINIKKQLLDFLNRGV